MARLKLGKKHITSIPITVKEIDKEKRTLTMVASTQDVDRHGDTIIQSGWDLGPYKKNPVILNSHRYDDAAEVIARAKSTKIEGKGKKSKLVQEWEFAVDENPKAKIIFDLYAGGYLHASSVGFIPRKFKEEKNGAVDYFTIEEAELLEVSAVSVPANATATLAKSIGVEESDLRETVKVVEDGEEDDAETPDEEEIQDESIDEDEADPEDEADDEEEADDEADDEEEPEDGAGEKAPEDNSSIDLEEETETPEPETPEDPEPETPEPARSVKPQLTKRQKYARAIHKLNNDQERALKVARDTIDKMLNGEDVKHLDDRTAVKVTRRKYNSVIRRLLKAK